MAIILKSQEVRFKKTDNTYVTTNLLSNASVEEELDMIEELVNAKTTDIEAAAASTAQHAAEAASDADEAESAKARAVSAASSSASSATVSQTAATRAETAANDAEAWAVGQRNGVDVPSTDDTYENNAKYYAGLAESSAATATNSETQARYSQQTASQAATTAASNATKALNSATDAQNAQTAAEAAQAAAASSASSARTSYTMANNSALQAQQSAQEATTASEATQTIVDALRIGGRNYLLNSDVDSSTDAYLMRTYDVSEPLIAGETYTLSLCVTPAENVTAFGAWLSTSKQKQGQVEVNGTDKQIVSFTFTAVYYSGMTPEDDLANAKFRIYRLPREGTFNSSTIHWAKVEKGNKATDWTPAPEDAVTYIANTETKVDSTILKTGVNNLDANETLYSKIIQNTDAINAVPEQITEAMDNLQIGGVNLILDTGWYRAVGTKWTFTDNTAAFIKFPYNTSTDGNTESDNNFGGCGFVNWNSPASLGTMWSRAVKVSTGQRYTFSFRYRGEGLKAIVAGYDSESNQTWGGEWSYTSTTTKDFSRTITIPANVVNIQLVFQVAASTSGVLGRIKMEQGDKATTWCPAIQDNPGFRFSNLKGFQQAMLTGLTEDSRPDTTLISNYPTYPGIFRVGSTPSNPIIGMPTGSSGYGVLFIVLAGDYYMHIYMDNAQNVYMAKTPNSAYNNTLSILPRVWQKLTTTAVDSQGKDTIPHVEE